MGSSGFEECAEREPTPFLATEEALQIRKKLGWFMGEVWVRCLDRKGTYYNIEGLPVDLITSRIRLKDIQCILTHDFLFSVLEKLIEERKITASGFSAYLVIFTAENIEKDIGFWRVVIEPVDPNDSENWETLYRECDTLIESLSRALFDAITCLEANDGKV